MKNMSKIVKFALLGSVLIATFSKAITITFTKVGPDRHLVREQHTIDDRYKPFFYFDEAPFSFEQFSKATFILDTLIQIEEAKKELHIFENMLQHATSLIAIDRAQIKRKNDAEKGIKTKNEQIQTLQNQIKGDISRRSPDDLKDLRLITQALKLKNLEEFTAQHFIQNKSISIKTSDDQIITLKLELLTCSKMINSMLDASNLTINSDPILLPEITSEQWRLIELLLPNVKIINDPESTKEEIETARTELTAKIMSYSLQQQRQLLLAVNFLDIPQILNETIKQISNSTELIESFRQNPESFIESEEFNTATNFLPHDLLKQLTKNSNFCCFLNDLEIAGHTIKCVKFNNGVIVAQLEDNTYRYWTINPDNSLQPLEIAGHTIIEATSSNGVIVATLNDNTYRILTINPDNSLQPLEIAGHTIEFASASNGVIFTRLEDNTYRVFIPKRITLQQALFINACKERPINLDSEPKFKSIFDSLPAELKQKLKAEGFVSESIPGQISRSIEISGE